MMRKILSSSSVFLVAPVIMALVPGFVFAQVVVTEVMYDLQTGADGGREWVEVYNIGTSPIVFSDWKLFENGTNHKITAVRGGSVLTPGAYAVIADNAEKFKKDWPQYNGALFDSTFSLSNEGETFTLRNASSTDVDTASYQNTIGAAGNGNSLNRSASGTAFVPRLPSPGAAMSATTRAPSPKEPVVKTPKSEDNTPAKAVVTSPRGEMNGGEPVPEHTVSAIDATSSQIAAVTSASGNSSVWWLGALFIAVLAGGGIFAAQRLGKHEWDITEVR
ncbi:MAG: lamin tail domain-containing protein [Patescibacteria group bacterium]